MMALAMVLAATGQPQAPDIRLETRYVRWVIGPDGKTREFADRRSGKDYAHPDRSLGFATAWAGGKQLPVTSAALDGERIRLGFEGGVGATVKVRHTPETLVFDLESVSGAPERLDFAQVRLALKGQPGEPFAACALARNLRTNVDALPGAAELVQAHAYKQIGMEGASVAVVAGPGGKLRDLLKKAVDGAPDIPHSPIGGPWALESPPNHGSYLFNFGGLNVEAAPKWIALAKALGARQIDFHGGSSFRFGDFRPDPKTYPRGVEDFRATIDALHAAGLQAGLHTYACFIDKQSKYVTPVPDPRLAVARTFTLAEPLDPAATTVTVAEPTEGLNATTGFFVTNSATLRIGEELVTFTAATQKPPYRFTGCTRGALGTRASAHPAGEKAGQLKELFGLFVPEVDSTLYTEIAENTARMYNECGFDMIYLDALDGSYIHRGGEWAWYYGARFVYEIWKRLEKPAIMEMSTFHHHLWVVRARMGAWDAAHTGFKEFIDMHRLVNRDCERMFLPSHLGWWAVYPWNGVQPDRTMPDDLEYLLCKSLAADAGLSFVQGFSPDTFDKSEWAQRNAKLIAAYEELRRGGKVPASVRKALGEPGSEFTLDTSAETKALVPVRYDRHVADGPSGSFTVPNAYQKQPLRVRIEGMLTTAAKPPADAKVLLSAADLPGLTKRAADGVTLDIAAEQAEGGPGGSVLKLTATSKRTERRGSWAAAVRPFTPSIDLTAKGLGVWINGDGKGEVLNFQLTSQENLGPGVAEHYVVVDFTGWRYIELIEPECDRLSAYSWPYAAYRGDWERNPSLAFNSGYKLHHPWTFYNQIATLTVWMNEVPAGGTATVQLGPVVALPLVKGVARDPRITLGALALEFPVDLASGQYLEYQGGHDAVVYGPGGETVRHVQVPGAAPELLAGDNAVTFICTPSGDATPRCRVSVITRGKPIWRSK